MGHFISAAVLRELAKQGKQIHLEKNSVLTPSARDLVKELGLTLIHGSQILAASGDKVVTVEQRVCFDNCPDLTVSLCAENLGIAGSENDNTDLELKNKVRKIIEETLTPACSNPQALHIQGDQVVIEPFAQAPPGQRIGLTDVVTAREGNLCAGFMTFENSSLPWFLNYDEADYIIEGDFRLEIGDQVFQAKAGDVVYIPKGSQVVFSSPIYCKVFYVTYPANWADFCD